MWILLIVIAIALIGVGIWWFILRDPGRDPARSEESASHTTLSDFVRRPDRYLISVKNKSVLSSSFKSDPYVEKGFILASGPRFLPGATVRIDDESGVTCFDGSLTHWNSLIAAQLTPSQDGISQELRQYLFNFDPYELKDKQERVDMCRWLGAFYGETGYVDPATGEYSTQSLQTRFKQHSGTTYATPHQLWPEKYHGMLTKSRLNDRIAPGWAIPKRNFQQLKSAAGKYCNGPKKERADGKYYKLSDEANCRAIYESYYGSCVYEAARLPESYCNK